MQNITTVNLSEMVEFDNHELVTYFFDKKTNLRGFIAIHNTNLGPATGGTRLQMYRSEIDALKDVLNLSKAMTYKCALAGVKFGGGKAVIIRSPYDKDDALFRSYAKKVNIFSGKFTTGTDVGISLQDTEIMATGSKYILGISKNAVKKYDTSKMAAVGVYHAICGAVEEKNRTSSLDGVRIAVKGLGKLGLELVRLLYTNGAKITVADIDKNKIKEAKKAYSNIKVVSPKEILSQDVEVYAPCALGNEFTTDNIKLLKANIIIGGANNQLSNEEVGDYLFRKGIIYGPDFLVNAGGLINIVDELEDDGYSARRVINRVTMIRDRLVKIIRTSQEQNIPTNRITINLANEIIYKKYETRIKESAVNI